MDVDYLTYISLERVLTGIIIIFLLVVAGRFWLKDFLRKRSVKKRFKRGAELEDKAKSFLQKKGFKIIGYQEEFYHNYIVDGKKETSKLIVDYIVKKKGKRYLVEVKSGNTAISIKDAKTRRQILEYDFVIENDGIYLLDMENETLHLIKFISKKQRNYFNNMKMILLLAGIAVVVPYWSVKVPVLLATGIAVYYFYRKYI
jgi:hypothetical protein